MMHSIPADATFLLSLSDALLTLASPLDIGAVVCGKLRGELQADSAWWYGSEFQAFEVPARAAVTDLLLAGQPCAVMDEPGRLPGFAAFIAVPMRGQGCPKAGIIVASHAPRVWTEAEIAAVEEVARRALAAELRLHQHAALRRCERHFHGFAAHSDDVIWIADADGTRLDFLSPGFERMFGAPREPVMEDSTRLGELVHPEDRAAVMPQMLGTKAASVHYRLVRPADGHVVPVCNTGFAIQGEDGAVGQVGGVMRDTSAIVAADAALRTEKDRFCCVLETLPQLLWSATPDCGWRWVAPQWEKVTGQAPEASLGWGWLNAVHPDDRDAARPMISGLAANDAPLVDLRLLMACDGAWRWHKLRIVPMRDEAGDLEWMGSCTDIEGLKRLEGEQRILLAELQHRTRNLLGLVRGMATQTLPAGTQLTAYDARLAAIGRVQGFLARSGDWTACLHEVIEAELEAAGGGCAKRAVLHGPAVELPGEWAQILAQVLHELTINSTKYGALAQPQAVLVVEWRYDRDDGMLTLNWRESGVSMPADAASRHGYGRILIEQALPYQLDTRARLEFGPDGIHCAITLPIFS